MRIPLVLSCAAALAATGLWLAIGASGGEGRTLPAGTAAAEGRGPEGEAPGVPSPAGAAVPTPMASSAFTGETAPVEGVPRACVQVLDHEGAPATGILVGLRDDADPDATALRTRGVTKAPDGIAALDLACDDAGAPLPRRLVILLPVILDPPVVVTGATSRKNPIVVRLPATGSLEISVLDERGRAVTQDDINVRVEVLAQDGGGVTGLRSIPFHVSPTADLAGWEALRGVGLGLRFRVTAVPRDGGGELVEETTEAPGPTVAGETACVELVVRRDRFPVVTGRIVRDDGTPWAPCTLEAIPKIAPSRLGSNYRWLRVTEGGRFRLAIRHECPPGGSRVYTIEDRDRERWPLGVGPETPLDLSRTLAPGVNDVGDVVLDLGSLIVSGSVVDEEGAAIAGAEIDVRTERTFPGGATFANIFGNQHPVSDLEGRFEVRLRGRGEPPAGDVRLTVTKRGSRGKFQKSVAVGTRDLMIVLTRGGGVAGSVKLAGDLRGDDLRVTIRSGRNSRPVSVQEDGRFRFEGLEPGIVTVSVAPSFGPFSGQPTRAEETLATVDNVVITAGVVNEDPRLQDIVIGAAVRRVLVKVLDPDLHPVPRAIVRRLDDAGRGEARWTNGQGEVTCALFGGASRLVVGAPGSRMRIVDGAAGEIEVILQPGIRVRLTTSARMTDGEPPCRLEAGIHPCDDRGRDAAHRILDPTAADHAFDAAGEIVALLPDPGLYRVRPMLRFLHPDGTPTGRAQWVTGAERVITVEDAGAVQSFPIEIPADLIEACLKAAGR